MNSMDDLGFEKRKGIVRCYIEEVKLKENLPHVPFVGHVFVPHLRQKEKVKADSIECFIEGQAPTPPPPPSPVSSNLDRQHIGRVRNRDNLLTGRGGWARGLKACSSINHSILSVEGPVTGERKSSISRIG
jgi:hypothetical protein